MSIETDYRAPFFRNDSTSTICSLDAEQIVNQRLRENPVDTLVSTPTQSSLKVGSVCIDGSKAIQVGDQITYHIYPPAPGINVVERNTDKKSNNQYIKNSIYRIWNNKCYCALVIIAILSTSVVIAASIVFFSKTLSEDKFTTTPNTQFTVTSTSTSTSASPTSELPATSILTQEPTIHTTTSLVTISSQDTSEGPETSLSPDSTLSLGFTSSSPESTTTAYPKYNFTIVTRSQWGAIEPRPGIKNLTLPIQRIILTHTADQMRTCNTEISCKERLKSMELEYNHLKDIPWNFLIGNDGNVYEGRGFNFEGEHTQNQHGSTFNDIGICIAFVGNFNASEVNPQMNETFNKFVEFALIERILTDNYTILYQGQLIQMASPANALFDQIKIMKNWYSISRVYDRTIWKAMTPCRSISSMKSIPGRIVLTHTGAETCVNLDECSQLIKDLQRNVMNTCRISDIDDIPFNFLIGGNGDVFEGRGWNLIGEHSPGFNQYLGIAVIGNFEFNSPNEAIVQALLKLIEDGIHLGKVISNYKINGRSELLSSGGPGEAFMKIIRTWSHYEVASS